MNDTSTGKPDWQVALEHHEDLCAERYKGIDRRFDAVDKRLDNIEKLQRITIGLVFGGFFAMPVIVVALLKFFF